MLSTFGTNIYFRLSKISKFFNKHPEKVCMTYFEHMQFALKLSLLTCYSSITSAIHSFCPFLFVTTASDINSYITNIINESGCRD